MFTNRTTQEDIFILFALWTSYEKLKLQYECPLILRTSPSIRITTPELQISRHSKYLRSLYPYILSPAYEEHFPSF